MLDQETFKARCDGCGDVFLAVRWNMRTCCRCAAAGMPDQSVGEWKDYLAGYVAWKRARRIQIEYERGLRRASGRVAARGSKGSMGRKGGLEAKLAVGMKNA